MRNNKILAVAIASVLSAHAGGVVAAKLTFVEPSDTTHQPPVFASELFSTSGEGQAVLEDGVATGISSFSTKDAYTLAYKAEAKIENNWTVNFTLSAGTWGVPVNAVTDVALCSSAAGDPVTGTCVGPVDPAVGTGTQTISKGALPAGEKDNAVDFFIQPNGDPIPASTTLYFTFQVDDLNVLATAGGSFQITASSKIEISAVPGTFVPIGSAIPQQLGRSINGVDVSILPDDTPGTVAIDVAQSSQKFTGGVSPTIVKLGTVSMKQPDGTPPLEANGTDEFDFTTVLKGDGSTLTVTSGIFSASQSVDSVLLDCDASDDTNFSDAFVIKPANVLGDTAVWNLTLDNLNLIADTSAAVGGVPCRVIVIADGTSTIEELENPPSVALKVTYITGSEAVYTGRFRHIKRNGTICTLYNIPNGTPEAIDATSVRITNTTSGQDGHLFATLRDTTGKVLYTAVDMLDGEVIKPRQTVRFKVGDDGTDSIDLTSFGGGVTWDGRAILTVTSDLLDMEVFGLLRNAKGGPLMNLSAGGTGSGCD
jgi:hypothetical protein